MTRRRGFDTQWLDEVLRTQDGLATYTQLVRMGLPHSTIADWIGPHGHWQRLLPGVYLSNQGNMSDWQRRRAALLYAGSAGTITGSEALHLHPLRYTPIEGRIRVLVPSHRQRTSSGFVIIERTCRAPETVTQRGLAFAPVPRAVMDLCRRLTDLRTVQAVIMESVGRALCTVDDLAVELAEGPTRGSWRPRLALEQARDGLRSPAEVDARAILRREGVPEALWNVPLYALDGQHVATPDAYFPEVGVAFEVDSRQHHLRAEDWEHTMRRHARLAALGVIVLHASPHRIKTAGAAVAAELKAALANAARRPLPAVTTTPPAAAS